MTSYRESIVCKAVEIVQQQGLEVRQGAHVLHVGVTHAETPRQVKEHESLRHVCLCMRGQARCLEYAQHKSCHIRYVGRRPQFVCMSSR